MAFCRAPRGRRPPFARRVRAITASPDPEESTRNPGRGRTTEPLGHYGTAAGCTPPHRAGVLSSNRHVSRQTFRVVTVSSAADGFESANAAVQGTLRGTRRGSGMDVRSRLSQVQSDIGATCDRATRQVSLIEARERSGLSTDHERNILRGMRVSLGFEYHQEDLLWRPCPARPSTTIARCRPGAGATAAPGRIAHCRSAAARPWRRRSGSRRRRPGRTRRSPALIRRMRPRFHPAGEARPPQPSPSAAPSGPAPLGRAPPHRALWRRSTGGARARRSSGQRDQGVSLCPPLAHPVARPVGCAALPPHRRLAGLRGRAGRGIGWALDAWVRRAPRRQASRAQAGRGQAGRAGSPAGAPAQSGARIR